MHSTLPSIYGWAIGLVLGCILLLTGTHTHAADPADQPTEASIPMGTIAEQANPSEAAPDRHPSFTNADPKTRHLNLLLSVLHEQKLDDGRRQEAALALLEMNDPQAIRLLEAELGDATDPKTQRLIATALVLLPHPPPKSLAPILFDALLSSGSLETPPLAKALGRYTDDALTRKLAEVASDTGQDLDRRRAAILALGHHRTSLAAGSLIAMLEQQTSQYPTALEQSIFAALESLTGRFSHITNRHQWITWWQENRNLSERQWFATIVHNLTVDRARIKDQKDLILVRLVDTQRRLYRSLPQPERPTVLVRLLGDDLATIRQLGIDLCVQRLIDTRPIGPEIRTALHPLLSDYSSDIRQRATQLAHDLADEQAAKIVARRLLEHADQDPQLLQTQLRLLARLPQPDAITRALDMLENPIVADDSAGFLAAAAEADMLNEEQSNRAAGIIRNRLQENPSTVKPQYVTLIAKIGTTEDWDLIQGWLDSEDESVKHSAARVWANSDQPLEPLLERSADPMIQQIVITAARQRGNTAQTLLALLDHKPDQQQAADAWERALLAVASRVSSAAVLQANSVMSQRDDPLELRGKILTAAIDNRPTVPPKTNTAAPDQETALDNQNNQTDGFILSELLLARAAVWQATGNAARALEDYQKIQELNATLSPRLTETYYFGRLNAHLATNGTDDALHIAETIIHNASGTESADTTIGRVVDLFIQDIQRNLDAHEIDHTRLVLTQLRQLLGNSMSDLLNQRLAELEDQSQTDTPHEGLPPSTAPISPPAPATNKTSHLTPRHPVSVRLISVITISQTRETTRC